MTLISPAYCSEADMQRLFGTAGETSFADHDADGVADDGVVNDCINQATEELNLYCQQWYTPAVLNTSTLINRWCTVLAIFFLCERRGNEPPVSIAAECARIMERLERVLTGALKIPGLAMRADMRPTYSNLQIDRRYPRSRVRVTKANSSDAPTVLSQDTTLDVPSVFE